MLARMPWRLFLLTAGFFSAAAFAYACAENTSGDCAENGTCPAPDDAAAGVDAQADGPSPDGGGEVAEVGADVDGADADAGDAGAALDATGNGQDGADSGDGADGATCNPALTPMQDPCVIDDLHGVFVSPRGSDSNPGTHTFPVKTMGYGITLAHLQGMRVYACAGTYAESLVVSAAVDGASVYGGLDCTSFSYNAGQNKVVVAPTVPGYALEVVGPMTSATFEDIEFDAHDADANNPAQPNSVAVFVHNATQLTLNRVVVVAGSARPGVAGASAGAPGNPSNLLAPPMLTGNSAVGPAGAASKTCTCPDDAAIDAGVVSSMGGAGGTPAAAAGAGLPSYGGDAGAGAPGANGVSCGLGGTAQSGADAPAFPASMSTISWGTLLAAGWVPAAGTAGSKGQAGQGGGGGGSGPVSLGMGGGGACGGCGGAGGKQGSGGGSSIAILSFDSPLRLTGCTLVANVAGGGGQGGNAEAGELGGSAGAGAGAGNTAGCTGGAGGTGSGGNGGQGGAAGLSLGIGYAGTAPTIGGVVVTPGMVVPGVTVGNAVASGGPGGLAGMAASMAIGLPGAAGAPGIDGIAQAVLNLGM
jgi:hypothetical protein